MTARPFLRCVALLTLCGVALGALWWVVAPASVATWGGDGFYPVTTEPTAYIAADVQFGLWMVLFGVAAGWWVRRRWADHALWALLALILGTVGAAAVAALVGGVLGPSSTPDVVVGTRVYGPLAVRAPGLLLIAPIVAVAWWFASDLVASWQEDADEAEPDGGRPAEGAAAHREPTEVPATPGRSEPSAPA